MNFNFHAVVALIIFGFSFSATAVSSDQAMLRNLLNDFLKGASESNAKVHDKFWDNDLVYTSSSGKRFGKEEIMSGLTAEAASKTPSTADYSAEDVEIRLYGETAVVAFRLVAATQSGKKTSRTEYFNTGTFRKSGDDWRAVAWQATKIPRKVESTKP